MKRRIVLPMVVLLLMLSTSAIVVKANYSSYIEDQTLITWKVREVTNFTMWYTGGGYCAAVNGSEMEFQITNLSNDVSGLLSLGNVSVESNNTMIALDLTLGVWPGWLPGLVVEVGENNIHALNDSAYAAAERVAGNWMNGTIVSKYENITVGTSEDECIVFDYQQDPPGTQVTHLAYSLTSGVLVEANTTVTFASTYILVLSLESLENPTAVDLTVNQPPIIALIGIIGGVTFAVLMIAFIRRKN